MDRLRAFEVFVAVVSRQGFARAAEALDTSPANVTRYIADLEAHLGTRLLKRHSRKLSLTESGEALFERAKSILEDMAEAEAISASSSLAPRGCLRINAPLSFGVLHLAPLWPKFRALHPEVELDVSLIDRMVDIVEEGFDLAYASRAAAPPSWRRASWPARTTSSAPRPTICAAAARPPRRPTWPASTAWATPTGPPATTGSSAMTRALRGACACAA